MNLLLKRQCYRSVGLKNKFKISMKQRLYQQSKVAKVPYFSIQSHHIRIIQDPLQYYLSIKKGINSASFRIGLSCLYLGTGTLQRYLLRELKKRKSQIKDLDITMVFDYNRSLRQQNGQSPVKLLYLWKQDIEQKENVRIGFNRISNTTGLIGEVMAVHHQKIAIFDNTLIIGGPNLSKNYFLNRKDRYMQFNQFPQMSDYLSDYLKILAQNSHQIVGPQNLQKKKGQNLDKHIKLWKMSYRPKKFHQTFSQQQRYLKKLEQQVQFQNSRKIKQSSTRANASKSLQISLTLTRNQQIAQSIGTSIKTYLQVQPQQYQQKIDKTRQNLFGIGKEQFIGNQLEIVENVSRKEDSLMKRGQIVHIFPFIHFPKLNITNQPKLFQSILQLANSNNDDINISSGYLNLGQDLIKTLQVNSSSQQNKQQNKIQILCSSPQANSFYQGGRLKRYIPYFYRCFQINLLKRFKNKKSLSILQFNWNNQWSFHAKGVWIKQSLTNTYLTIIGSSNYNKRSEITDTELQLYIVSNCQKFNKRLDNEYQAMKTHCKQVTHQQLINDKEVNCTTWIQLLSKAFKRFL